MPLASREGNRAVEASRESSIAHSATTRRDCDILSADNLAALRSAHRLAHWKPEKFLIGASDTRERVHMGAFLHRESDRASQGLQ